MLFTLINIPIDITITIAIVIIITTPIFSFNKNIY